jgi:predicted metalloenzyme YecM
MMTPTNGACEHLKIAAWTMVHERASMEKRTGSTGKTYRIGGWECVGCGLPFYPEQKNHRFVSSQTEVDREINALR